LDTFASARVEMVSRGHRPNDSWVSVVFLFLRRRASGKRERFHHGRQVEWEKNWHISKGVTESSVAGSVASRQVAPSHRQELNYRPVEECRYMQMYIASIY